MRALYKSNIRGKYWPIVLARSADTRAINFSFLRKMNILFFSCVRSVRSFVGIVTLVCCCSVLTVNFEKSLLALAGCSSLFFANWSIFSSALRPSNCRYMHIIRVQKKNPHNKMLNQSYRKMTKVSIDQHSIALCVSYSTIKHSNPHSTQPRRDEPNTV